MDVIAVIVGALYISRRAAAKGYTGAMWGLYAVLAYFAAYAVGYTVVVPLLNGGQRLSIETVMAGGSDVLISLLLMLALGIGGILAVRAALDRLPARNSKSGPPDWMDRDAQP